MHMVKSVSPYFNLSAGAERGNSLSVPPSPEEELPSLPLNSVENA